MFEIHFFDKDSLVFMDTSALLAAGTSSNAVNHFLDDLRQMRRDSNSTIVVSESVIKELEVLNNGTDDVLCKAASRVLGSLLSYVKAQEIRLAKNDSEEEGMPLGEAISIFFETQIASLQDDHRIYIVTNDLDRMDRLYNAANGNEVCFCEVEEHKDTCKLVRLTPNMFLKTPKPVKSSEDESGTQSKEAKDGEQEKRAAKQKRIDAVIQIDSPVTDSERPEVVRDGKGNIKVPHL